MVDLLFIGIGGFIGAVLRYLLGSAVQEFWGRGSQFPLGTMVVNVVGCLVIGFLSLVAEQKGILSGQDGMFIFVGLLGAFTTFSTFSKDSFALWSSGSDLQALLNIGLHIVLGLGAVWLGRFLGKRILA